MEENIKTRVRERFKEKYPSTDERFKECMECFVGWVVDETIKELKDEDEMLKKTK